MSSRSVLLDVGARGMRRVLVAAGLLIAQGPMFAQTSTPENNQNQLSGVDAIIALVQANMSESFVIKHIKREGKAYNLSAADLLKLQKAGVSEKIIEFMMDPQEPSAPPPLASKTDAAAVSPAESAGEKKEGKRSFFGRVGGSLAERSKRLAGRSVDSAEQTLDKNAAELEESANRKVDAGQEKVDRTVETKLDSAQQKSTPSQGTPKKR